MENKRGVSPLLATILLIAFSIALATIVSTYIINKTKQFDPESIAQESTYCESVTLSYRVNDPKKLSISNPAAGVSLLNGLNIVNKGAFSIYQFKITAPGRPTKPEVLNPPLEPGGSIETLKIQLNKDSDDKEIKIVPVIRDAEKGELVICASRQVVLNYEELCQDILSTPGNPVTECPES